MSHTQEKALPFRVVIAGAGLGGLALAHRLLNSGVDVTVFERDAAPFIRPQGFRITADQHGFDALRRSLRSDVYRRVLETSGPPGGHFRFTNERLRDAFVLNFDPATSSERQIDREVLRRILLAPILEHVKFGRDAVAVREDASGTELEFADGTVERADVVVVADGIGSKLRESVFPDAEPTDTGRGGIYGRAPLRQGSASLIPDQLLDSGVLALLSAPGSAFFFTTMRFTHPPSDVLDASPTVARLRTIDDYVMWGLVLPPDPLKAAMDDDPQALWDRAKAHVASAHPLIRSLVAASQPGSILLSRFAAGRRPGPSTMSRVAVLGDAVHPMPPFGAHGGNTALRDASTLGDHLLADGKAQDDVAAAIVSYHNAMIEYAFEAVDAAMHQMTRLSTENAIQRWILRRVLPAFHRRTLPDHWRPNATDPERAPLAR